MDRSAATFALTDQIELTEGSHILYFYSSSEAYLSNAASFIRQGLELEQQVVLIDSEANYASIRQRLPAERRDGRPNAAAQNILFYDHRKFYFRHGHMSARQVLHNLEELFGPLLKTGQPTRSWGHVFWNDQEDIFNQLQEYEYECEKSIGSLGIIGVCIYDAKKVPAHLQNEMMRWHEYLMTDTSVARSPFYEKQPAAFPSPLVQDQLNSEMDHYRQKLDFIHVVSHEVRNPLTVIKAYAKMLLGGQQDHADKEKLQAIADYADVIDYEMTHIINTEQMLATDSLWAVAETEMLPIVEEVAAMMTIKARTQNIKLHSRIALTNERTPSNAIGLRLIVSNLLSNAIKYSEEGDCVWLEAALAEADWIELRFRDEGCGMTAEQQEKLFRKYEKTNTEKGGQGIGLFMVKKLVDHFAGTIAVASEFGKGTEVTVRLRACVRPMLPQKP